MSCFCFWRQECVCVCVKLIFRFELIKWQLVAVAVSHTPILVSLAGLQVCQHLTLSSWPSVLHIFTIMDQHWLFYQLRNVIQVIKPQTLQIVWNDIITTAPISDVVSGPVSLLCTVMNLLFQPSSLPSSESSA